MDEVLMQLDTVLIRRRERHCRIWKTIDGFLILGGKKIKLWLHVTVTNFATACFFVLRHKYDICDSKSHLEKMTWKNSQGSLILFQ